MTSLSRQIRTIVLRVVLAIATVSLCSINFVWSACSAPVANVGALDFQSSVFKYCDGTNWLALGGASFPLQGPNGTATGPTYSFSAGTNTGIYSTGAGVLAFTTAGTQRVVIGSSGNVGVGTNAPAEKFDVNGAIKIGTTTGSNAGTLRWTGTNFQGYTGAGWQNLIVDLPASGSCDTTQVYNAPGVHSYTVPAGYATITVKVWGAGGGGGYSGSNSGNAGGSSSISSLGLNAGGGGGGLGGSTGAAGAGGVASGGTVNTNGSAGVGGAWDLGGNGAAAPGGGGTGGAGVPSGNDGFSGNSPGGGGGGTAGTAAGGGGGGGGSGSYVEKTYTTATLPVGTNINDIIVGAGGLGGSASRSAGAGGAGTVSIVCSTTGAPPVNNRGILFLDSGAYSSDSNFVYDASGNVGIGTTTPSAPLEVNRSAPGTISSSGTTVTGTGTTFTSTFKVGDTIYAYGQSRVISAIASDTSLTTSSAFSPAPTSLGYTRVQAKLAGTLELESSAISANGGGPVGQDLLVLKNLNSVSEGWNTGSAIRFEGPSGKFAGRIASAYDGGTYNYNLYFQTSGAPNAMSLLYGGQAGFNVSTWGAGFEVQSPAWGVTGARFKQSLSASANNDALTAVVIDPTFTNGAYTGVTNNGLIVTSGNVGIGTTAPSAKLVVAGAAINETAVSNGTATIDFSTSNLQYTTADCGAFALHNLKSGGSYTFGVQGTNSTTCSFTAYSDAGSTSLTVHMPTDHGATVASKHTLYTFIVMGTHAYVAWTPGL